MKDKRVVTYGGAVLFFVVLVIGMTWPLLPNIRSHLPAGTDSIVHYWNAWWAKVALSQGQSPFYTESLFFPDGISLVYHNFAWIHIGLDLLLQSVLSPVAGYNLSLLLNLVLCGLTLSWLAYALFQDRLVALFSGVIYLTWPYRLNQLDHPNLISTWPIPIFFLFLLRILNGKGRWNWIGAGFAFATIGYMRWQLLIPTTLIGIIFVISYLLLYRDWNALRGQLGRFSLAAGLAILLLGPPIYLLANEWQTTPAQLVPTGEELAMQTDALAFVTPPPRHSLIGQLTTTLYGQYYADRGSRAVVSPYIGLLTLGLAVSSLFFVPRTQSWPWAIIALALVGLALGPTFRINGNQYDAVPTLYRLLDRFFILRLMREPDRFNMFLALPAAILAGYGVMGWLKRVRCLRYRPVILFGFFALLLLETTIVPVELQAVEPAQFYMDLIGPDGGAVLDIPVDPFKAKPYMLAQTTHGRPIVAGHASRYPEGAFSYLESTPWLNETLIFDGQPPLLPDLGVHLSRLAADGYSHIVLHKGRIQPNYLARWRMVMGIEPLYEDEEILVFGIDPLPLEPDQPPTPLRVTASAACLEPHGIVGVDVTWAGEPTTLSRPNVVLELSNQVERYQSEIMPLTSIPPGEHSPTLVLGSYEWDLFAEVVPGNYELELLLLAENGEEAARFDVLRQLEVQEATCLYDPPAGVTPVNARFGDLARLVGYDLEVDASELALTHYWRPEQRTGVEYTVFVHLFDLQTGLPVAQVDAMPRNWTYPTSRWGLNEIIDETIQLDIRGIPAGNYGIGVGLYNGATGERLEIVTASGEVVPDARLVLQQVMID